MAQLKVDIGKFSLTSQWKCSATGVKTYGPTTAKKTFTINYTLPVGAKLNSAIIYATLGSPNTGIAVASVNSVSIKSGAADVTAYAIDSQINATFSFKAYGRSESDTNTHSGVLAFTNVYLLIDYTPAMPEWEINVTEVEIGSVFSVTIEPVDKAIEYYIDVRYPGGAGEGVIISANETPYHEFTVPEACFAGMPNSYSEITTITVQARFFNADTNEYEIVGEETRGIKILVPDYELGVDLQLTTINSGAWPSSFACVQGISSVKATILSSASQPGALYGATIVSQKIVGAGYTSDSGTLVTGVINKSGAVEFTATIIDSRGKTATRTRSIQVSPYVAPVIRAVMQSRADSSGAVSKNGTYINVGAVYTFSEVDNNSTTAVVRYRQYGAAEWIDSYSGTLASGDVVLIGDGQISIDLTYEVQILISDKVNTATVIRTVGPAAAYVYWDPQNNAIGFGCRTVERKTIQIAEDWTLKIGAQSLMDLIKSIDTCSCPPIVTSATQPSDPVEGMIWLDIS